MEDAPLFERSSKALAAASLVGILILALAAHPDLTWPMRLAVMVAFAVGWFASATHATEVQAACLLAAPLAPALLRSLTEKEGPVLDLLWMAPLTTSILRTTAWSRWAMPPAWRVPAGGWALAVALVWPIVVAREVSFDAGGLWDLGRGNSDIGISAPHSVMWTLYVAWTQLAGLLWLDVSSERASRTPDALTPAMRSLWVGGTIATIVALYQGLVDLQFANTPFWAAEARATGTMLDANAYGMVAALAGPMAFIACLAVPSRRAAALATAVLLANVAGMWLSGSRTAALCGLIALGSLVAAMSGASAGLRRRLLPMAVGGVALTAALIVAGSAIGPMRRLLELPDSPTAAVINVLNRGPYGTIALRMIRDYPLTGVGEGGYNVIAPDYYRALWGSGLPFDNAQNWWRQIVAEGGLLGSPAPFALSALLAWCAFRLPPRPERRREATLVRGLIVALGVGSVIQIPTQSPVVMLWLCSLAGWLPSLVTAPPSSPVLWRPWPRAAWLLAVIAAVGLAAGQTALAGGSLDPAARARRLNREWVVGTTPLEPLAGGGVFRWMADSARFEWPVAGEWLVLRFWAPHPDIGARPVHVTIRTMCGVVFDADLRSHEVVSLGLHLPAGLTRVAVSFEVSHTWRPITSGASGDTRRLGLGVAAHFSANQDGLANSRYDLASCKA